MTDDHRPSPLDRLLTPVDTVVQQVINHIDLNAILKQIDFNELIERVDLEAVVERSVRQATRRTLDSARSEGARFDHCITRFIDRLLRRPHGWRVGATDGPNRIMTSPKFDGQASDQSSCYAGAATRVAAWIVDLFVSHALFALFTLTVVVVVDLFTGKTVHVQVPAVASALADVSWLFLYYVISWATVGQTPGMALIGLRVVRRDGSKLHAGRAAIRTVVLQFSFIVLGLGFVGILVGREHRALQDVAADTIVVYDRSAGTLRRQGAAPMGHDTEATHTGLATDPRSLK